MVLPHPLPPGVTVARPPNRSRSYIVAGTQLTLASGMLWSMVESGYHIRYLIDVKMHAARLSDNLARSAPTPVNRETILYNYRVYLGLSMTIVLLGLLFDSVTMLYLAQPADVHGLKRWLLGSVVLLLCAPLGAFIFLCTLDFSTRLFFFLVFQFYIYGLCWLALVELRPQHRHDPGTVALEPLPHHIA
ncbi:hypothetical protein RI367_005701 [Sorochytrium milnesiophthora]